MAFSLSPYSPHVRQEPLSPTFDSGNTHSQPLTPLENGDDPFAPAPFITLPNNNSAEQRVSDCGLPSLQLHQPVFMPLSEDDNFNRLSASLPPVTTSMHGLPPLSSNFPIPAITASTDSSSSSSSSSSSASSLPQYQPLSSSISSSSALPSFSLATSSSNSRKRDRSEEDPPSEPVDAPLPPQKKGNRIEQIEASMRPRIEFVEKLLRMRELENLTETQRNLLLRFVMGFLANPHQILNDETLNEIWKKIDSCIDSPQEYTFFKTKCAHLCGFIAFLPRFGKKEILKAVAQSYQPSELVIGMNGPYVQKMIENSPQLQLFLNAREAKSLASRTRAKSDERVNTLASTILAPSTFSGGLHSSLHQMLALPSAHAHPVAAPLSNLPSPLTNAPTVSSNSSAPPFMYTPRDSLFPPSSSSFQPNAFYFHNYPAPAPNSSHPHAHPFVPSFSNPTSTLFLPFNPHAIPPLPALSGPPMTNGSSSFTPAVLPTPSQTASNSSSSSGSISNTSHRSEQEEDDVELPLAFPAASSLPNVSVYRLSRKRGASAAGLSSEHPEGPLRKKGAKIISLEESLEPRIAFVEKLLTRRDWTKLNPVLFKSLLRFILGYLTNPKLDLTDATSEEIWKQIDQHQGSLQNSTKFHKHCDSICHFVPFPPGGPFIMDSAINTIISNYDDQNLFVNHDDKIRLRKMIKKSPQLYLFFKSEHLK